MKTENENDTTGTQELCISLLSLRIRNLISAREFNIAEANRELSLGGWLSDHRHEDNILAGEIDELIEKANAELIGGEAVRYVSANAESEASQ